MSRPRRAPPTYIPGGYSPPPLCPHQSFLAPSMHFFALFPFFYLSGEALAAGIDLIDPVFSLC